jgi:hypothetical protein
VARRPRRYDRLGRAACTLGVGAVRIEPKAERHTDRIRPGAQEGDGAVDAAAHRDRDTRLRRRCAEGRAERVGERVDGERLAPDRRRLEQRQAREWTIEAVGVRVDDPVAVDREPHERKIAPAGRVPQQLDHSIRLATGFRRAATVRGLDPVRGSRIPT